MRYPINLDRQTSCPVCKKAGAGRRKQTTPRPESYAISFSALSHVHGRSYPVYLSSLFVLDWDSGVPFGKARTIPGATVLLAEQSNKEANRLQVVFCSAACLRQFLKDAVTELTSRANAKRVELQRTRPTAAPRAVPHSGK